MDYDILSVAGFAFAIFCGYQVGLAVFRRVPKAPLLAAWATGLPVFAAVFVLAGDFADYAMKRECLGSHDPHACVQDNLDPLGDN